MRELLYAAFLVGGIGTSVVLHRLGFVHWLHVAWWSFIASALLLILGSRLLPRRAREVAA